MKLKMVEINWDADRITVEMAFDAAATRRELHAAAAALEDASLGVGLQFSLHGRDMLMKGIEEFRLDEPESSI